MIAPTDRLILHVCCGPCLSGSAPAWRAEGLEPEGLFCNPNIQPGVEHARRLQSARHAAQALALPLEVRKEEIVLAQPWLPAACADGRPPASPARCATCIGARLMATAAHCAAVGADRFATTLAISPYQDHDAIRARGEAAADAFGVQFLYSDQRRHYARSREESRRLGLYRQKYCGCVPSKWEAWRPPRRAGG